MNNEGSYPQFPASVETSAAADAICSTWAVERQVSPEAMIMGCTLAHMLRQSEPRYPTQIGSVMVLSDGSGFRITTVEEFAIQHHSAVPSPSPT